MERPLKEIKLPVSKGTASIVTYFTHAEVKQIESIKFAGSSMRYENDNTVIDNIPVDYRDREDDETLRLGIKQLRDSEGKLIEITKENLDGLPSPDVRVLLLELLKVRTGVESDKKK